MMASRIDAIQGSSATVFAQGDDLEWPNGLLVEGDRLIVGGKPEADFSTTVPGRDHAFVAAGNITIVPHMMENKVVAYDLSEVLK